MSGGRFLVTGATGRLGRTALYLLGERGLAGVRSPEFQDGEIVIGSDGEVDSAKLRGIDAIINCAGRVYGSAVEIEEANIAYPVALAKAARAAGVPRFVQVSSFSVYGRIEQINLQSAVSPVDMYGRSKLTAERALLDLATPEFRPIPLRLPFMFSADHPALLGRLVSIMLRLRALPSPWGQPSRRSMITYAGAADALISCALRGGSDDVLIAADPRPLALTEIAQAISQQLGRHIAVLTVPRPVVAIAAMVIPSIANRLFRSSLLSTSANMLSAPVSFSVESELHEYLARLRHNLERNQSAGQPEGT